MSDGASKTSSSTTDVHKCLKSFRRIQEKRALTYSMFDRYVVVLFSSIMLFVFVPMVSFFFFLLHPCSYHFPSPPLLFPSKGSSMPTLKTKTKKSTNKLSAE